MTRSQENTPVDFSLEFTCQAPYTYAELVYPRGSFLEDYTENNEPKYNNKLKSITFTNNQADFDMSKVVDVFDVGEVYDEDGSKASDLYTYFIPNGELFDAYCYAPVNVIYLESNEYGCFGSWLWETTSVDEEIEYIWQNLHVEKYDFKALDTSKSTNMTTFFCENLALTEIKNMYFDTSNVTEFMVAFSGVKLDTLDLSRFDFSSVTDSSYMLGFIGINDNYLKQMFGDIASTITEIPITNIEERAKAIASYANGMTGFDIGSCLLAARALYSMSIDKIICPKDLNGLVIATPGETPYLIEGTNETTYVLVEGATLIAQN